MGELDGRVAIVTGAASGIGRATSFALAAEGADIVVADIDPSRGRLLAVEINDKEGRAEFVPVDVADDDSVAAMAAVVVKRFGRVDIAFNNAGIEGTSAATHECAPANWARTIAVNLSGVWYCMRHEIPVMLEHGRGAIVNCASVAGLVGFPATPAYTASKHGVVGLTKAAALDYATSGIRVNAVCPGVIDTEMVQRFTRHAPDVEAALIATEPMGRMGHPEEIADAVVWLCSERSSFVTGQAIAVDGGFVAR